jgi:glycosyltransferase involved in cell wall biosynthesis
VSRLHVAYLLGTAAGGTGAHVAMLAAGCARHGAAVTVYGPAATGERFFAPSPGGTPPATGLGVACGGGAAGGGRHDDRAVSGWAVRAAGEAATVRFVPVEFGDRPHPARDAVAVLRLRRLLADGPPGVLHAHGLRAGALAALALAAPVPRSRRRLPLVVTVHNAPPAARGARLVYRMLARLAARRADAVTCVSADLVAMMSRLGAASAARALVPAAAGRLPSPAEAAAARAGLGGHGRPLVLAAGRLVPQKGLHVLLAAATRWRERVPPPLVAIAGDGPLSAGLRRQAAASGVGAVFLGQRGDIPVLLAAADVVVVPSEWEGQPLIVQETLRAGRPLVAARAGGIPELTGEDGALLVPPGDPAALAAAVSAVLGDPALAARLAAAARSRAALLPTPAAAVTAALRLYGRLAACP